MKIAKMVPMNYTVVYVEDEGKYSAYLRKSSGEWKSHDEKSVSPQLSERLESLFKKESEENGK